MIPLLDHVRCLLVSEQSTRVRNGRLTTVTFGVAACVVMLDQFTKYLAVTHLQGQPPVEVLGTWLQFTFLRNPGAAFSVGTSYTFVFTAIAVAVAVVIIRTSRNLGNLWWAIALGGLLGGAIGNLLDRLFREPGFLRGYVIDWIAFPNFPVFNIADSAIVCSSALMVLLAVRGINLDGSQGE